MRLLWQVRCLIWLQCAAAWCCSETPPTGFVAAETALDQYKTRRAAEGATTYEGALAHWPLPVFMGRASERNKLILRQQTNGTYRVEFYENAVRVGAEERWVVQQIDEGGRVAASAQVPVPADGQYFVQAGLMLGMPAGAWVRIPAASGFAIGTLMATFIRPDARHYVAAESKAWVRVMHLNGPLTYENVRYYVVDATDVTSFSGSLPLFRSMQAPMPPGGPEEKKASGDSELVPADDVLKDFVRRRLQIPGTVEHVRAEQAPLGSAANKYFDGKLTMVRYGENAAACIVSNRTHGAGVGVGEYNYHARWFNSAGRLQDDPAVGAPGTLTHHEVKSAKVSERGSADWLAKNNQWVRIKNASNIRWLGNIVAVMEGTTDFPHQAWVRIFSKAGRPLPIDEVEYVFVPLNFLLHEPKPPLLKRYPVEHH